MLTGVFLVANLTLSLRAIGKYILGVEAWESRSLNKSTMAKRTAIYTLPHRSDILVVTVPVLNSFEGFEMTSPFKIGIFLYTAEYVIDEQVLEKNIQLHRPDGLLTFSLTCSSRKNNAISFSTSTTYIFPFF